MARKLLLSSPSVSLDSSQPPISQCCSSQRRSIGQARRDKERKYGELLEGDRCQLVVVGVETGGRWSQEACYFVTSLAAGRCRDVLPVLRRSAHLAWQRRWMRMLAISCGKAFASQPPCCPLLKTLGRGLRVGPRGGLRVSLRLCV